ncbi:hypothetical protein FSB08_11220 [Paraburkholderia sp. JPY432]|uniref:hypothetical protein n=1 Tax=Paraburkholderia youngii TaxID=2782701 RepID=UPI001595DD91|nr:hypothetical protein [Paraburkholderia youngii]NVH73133.1 hypothetical protein [Paraburkholderia youngii]
MKNVSMLICGEQVQARNGASFERGNPLDGEVASRAPAAAVEDAIAAVRPCTTKRRCRSAA